MNIRYALLAVLAILMVLTGCNTLPAYGAAPTVVYCKEVNNIIYMPTVQIVQVVVTTTPGLCIPATDTPAPALCMLPTITPILTVTEPALLPWWTATIPPAIHHDPTRAPRIKTPMPPTSVPPTAVPPTHVPPPTSVPPTHVPDPTHAPRPTRPPCNH